MSRTTRERLADAALHLDAAIVIATVREDLPEIRARIRAYLYASE